MQYLRPFVRALLVTTVPLLLAAAPSPAAEVYKWVDAKGRTHFGDKPPESGPTARRIKTPANPAPAPSPGAEQRRRKQQKLLDAFASDRQEKANQRQKDRQAKAKLHRQCAITRHNLEILERSNQLYRKDKKGNRQYASEEQRANLIERTRQALKKHCKSG